MVAEIISSVVTLGTLLFGGGVLYYRQNKMAKVIDNEARQSEEWRKLYDEQHAERKERDNKIDRLYAEIKSHRDEKIALRNEVAELKTQIIAMKIYRCEKPGCPHRQPPTGY